MSSSNRPIYVPRQKRIIKQQKQQQQQQRFHGAFTGGFSAGYYNTVGSSEGWKPSYNNNNYHIDDDVNDDQHRYERDNNNNNRNGQAQQFHQRIEHFMDEQDHNEWGGPSNVKEEFISNSESRKRKARIVSTITKETNNENLAGFDSILNQVVFQQEEPSYKVNIGKRLLRHLGWKGNNTVYAPADSTLRQSEEEERNGDGDENIDEYIFLSKRNLRKIQLQQTRVQIPVPKLDTTGLGYVPFANAPEFQAAKERRMKLSQQRISSLHGKGKNKNVYRISDVLAEDQDSNQDDDDDDGAHPTHGAGTYQETLEDFVGTKSASGFALHDDDDNAYDDNHAHTDRVPSIYTATRSVLSITNHNDDNYTDAQEATKKKKLHLDQDAYDTVAYEHSDSDPDEMHESTDISQPKYNRTSRQNNADVLGSLLTSWATGKSNNTTSGETVGGEQQQQPSKVSSYSITSDGKPILSGFVLGSNTTGSGTALQRFRGPDIPSGYQVTPHQFTPDERPSVYQVLARTEKEEVSKQRYLASIKDMLDRNVIIPIASAVSNNNATVAGTQKPQALPIMNIKQKSNAFVGIAESMKNRFTTSSYQNNEADTVSRPAGLSLPSHDECTKVAATTSYEQQQQSKTMPVETGSSSAETTIKRSVVSFVPAPLLCKRFHVAYQINSNTYALASSVDRRTREEAYFQDEILKRANDAAGNSTKEHNVEQQQQEQQNTTTTEEQYKQQAKRILQQLLAELNDDSQSGRNTQHNHQLKDERPSISIYKSIFEPPSASSSDDEDNLLEAGGRDHRQVIANNVRVETMDTETTNLIPTSKDNSTSEAVATDDLSTANEPEQRIVPYDEGQIPDKHKQSSNKRRNRKRERHSRKTRSRSFSSDSYSTTSSDYSLHSHEEDDGHSGSPSTAANRGVTNNRGKKHRDFDSKKKHRESKSKKRKDADDMKKRKKEKKRSKKKHKKTSIHE